MSATEGQSPPAPKAAVAASAWRHPVRRLYDWVLHWAGTRHATQALFWLSFAESSFFPIPPDVLLIAMTLARPAGAMSAALVCTLASVFGGIAGYGIGLMFFDLVGRPILDAYGIWDSYLQAQSLYREWDAWAVAIAGFTPIPYKLFTIAGGAFRIDFATFVLASIASRAARFFLVAWIVRRWGPPVRAWVERYFNLATLIFALLLIGGFAAVKALL